MKKLILILLTALVQQSVFAAEKMKNGAPFFGETDQSLPRNILLLSFQGGPAAISTAQQGAVAILKEILKEGPADQTMSQFKQELFELGAEIETSTAPNMFQVILMVPPAQEVRALELLKQTLEKPRTSEADFKEYHAKVLAGIKTKFEDMRSVIFYFGPRDLMKDSKQLRIGDTSPASLEKLTYADFKAALPKILDYQGLFISYIGPEAVAQAKANVQAAFADKMKASYKRWKVEEQNPVDLKENRYTLIDKPGATDNQILILHPSLVKRDSPQWQVSQITMDTLGGGLHGRLGKVLRSERGLTYGASSSYSSQLLPYWLVWTFGGLEQTKPLLTGVPEVIAAYKTAPLTATDLAESKARLMNSFLSSTELPKDRLAMKGWYYGNGLPTDLAEKYPKRLAQADLKTVTVFQKSLQSKTAAVYIMGDKEKVLPMLEATGVKKESVRIVPVSDIQ